MKRFVCFFLLLFAATSFSQPPEIWDNVSDYTFMWWKDGWRNSSDIFNIQTSRYGLSFDYDDFQINNFGPLTTQYSEGQALGQGNDIIAQLPAVSMECSVKNANVKYKVVSSDSNSTNCMLVESGKFFQRRWFEVLNFETGVPAGKGHFQVAAWPDRVSFTLFFTPDSDLTDAGLEFKIDLEDQYSEFIKFASAKGFTKPGGDCGYVFMAESTGLISCDETEKSCSVNVDLSNWTSGEEKTVGLIVYPLKENCSSRISEILYSELSPPSITAEQLNPVSSPVSSSYDKNLGFNKIDLRSDQCGGITGAGNDRIERVRFTITNNYDFAYPARLCFSKLGNVCGITGISAILCDSDNDPIGVPVQLSKDWHNSSNNHRFDIQSWYRGMSFITVPAQSSVELVYTSVNAHWGGVAAASHAQLCLIGWGGNQLWDEAALGSWGESITYDPDVNLNRSMVDDVRPMMVWNMNSDTEGKWWWTNNVGGCDFLTLFNSSGGKLYNSNMKSMYSAYCPNVTDVTYSGTNANDNIKLSCRTRLIRTDDYVRAVYDLRYDVVGPVRVDANPVGNNNRIAFFQFGADGYNNHNFEKIARGDENGLVEEWSPVKGGLTYSRTSVGGTGSVNWFSLHESNSNDTSLEGAWANRGMVVRDYHGRLGGVEQSVPYFSVYGTNNGNIPSANIELSIPSGVTQLQAGDYVEAQVVYVIVPQFESDYYGPNANLTAALTQYEDSWEMIHRESVGNDLEINMIGGQLLSSYPLHVKNCNGLEFEVTGGLGYVPMTFENLTSHKGNVLEEYQNDAWVAVDQSYHGKDFWQTDYDSTSQTWSRTYTVNLDSPSDARVTRRFRVVGPGIINTSSDFNCDSKVDVLDLGIFSQQWFCLEQSLPEYQDSCVAWWKFDENDGTFLGDSSGSNNYGIVTGAAWVSGVNGSALDFEGADNVTMTVNDLSSITDQITIALWVYGDDVQPQVNHLLLANNSRGTVIKVHLPWGNGDVFWDAGNDSSSMDRVFKTASSSEYKGQWNHWVFAKNGTTGNQSIYLNGSPWHSETGKTKMFDGITSFQISMYDYEGIIDDLRVFDIELNPEQVQSVFEQSTNISCGASVSDLNNDGDINLIDFSLLAFDWLIGI